MTAVSNSPRWLAVAVFLFVLAIYLAMPTKNYYWDGLIYGEFIESVSSFGVELFHPNHLIYNFAGYLAYHGLGAIGLGMRALYALQYLTIVFGAISVTIFFLIADRSLGSRYLALVSSGLMAFAAGWWRFATDADVYVISVAFLLLSFYLLLPDRKPRPIVAALVFSLAMLFHEIAVLFLPAGCLGVWFQTRESSTAERLIAVLKFAGVAFVIAFGSYYGAFYSRFATFDLTEFFRWITTYASVAKFEFSLRDGMYWLWQGNRRLFIDGSIKLFRGDWVSWIALSAMIVFGLLLAISVLRRFRDIRSAGEKSPQFDRRLAILCLAWIVPFNLFSMFFLPENTFYRILYFPAVVLLIAALVRPFHQRAPAGFKLALLVASFSLYNFVFYVYPNYYVQDGSVLALAKKANNYWSGNTVVFFDPSRVMVDSTGLYMRYFNPDVRWRPIDEVTTFNDLSELGRPHPDDGEIWFESSAIERLKKDPVLGPWAEQNLTDDVGGELNAPAHRLQYFRLSQPTR